jgi:uncharacterized protein (DUF488 family)
MKLFSIGFTRTSAEGFFCRLIRANVRKLVDVRLNNVSQLSGFAKADDLRFIADRIGGMAYEHLPILAPTKAMLQDYRGSHAWPTYKARFLALLAQRQIETTDRSALDRACLVCSEAEPERCHRRLVAEYLQDQWSDVEIIHL